MFRNPDNWRRWSASASKAAPKAQKSRKLMGAVAAGILTCIVGMVIFRDATAGSRARFFGSPTRLAFAVHGC